MNNRFLTLGAIALLSATAFTSCDDNPDIEPVIDPVEVSDGVFVVNQGNYYSNIAGTLTYVDFDSKTATQKAFAAANSGMVLGDTPQDAIVYGSKLYIAVYDSNIIRVVDRKTLSLIKDIQPGSGSVPGSNPRYITAHEGKLYISMYDGYVAKLDTVALNIENSVKVGPNPDGIAVFNNRIYVANSDGMNYLAGYANGKTVSEIDIATFSELRKIPVGLNPGQVAATSAGVYVICRGDYSSIPSTLQAINADGSTTDICTATLMCATESALYYIDSPVDGGGTTAFSRRAADTGATVSYSIDRISAPAAIGVEPVSGNIFITAYTMGDYGYADYNAPGFMNHYDENGNFVARYDVGLSPCAIAFNNSIVYNVR